MCSAHQERASFVLQRPQMLLALEPFPSLGNVLHVPPTRQAEFRAGLAVQFARSVISVPTPHSVSRLASQGKVYHL